MSDLDTSRRLAQEGLHLAKSMTNALTGHVLPEDDVAWVIKCDFNRRYFWNFGRADSGPITVARLHARRFATKAQAIVEMECVKARTSSPNVKWRIVRLRSAKATHR